MEHKIDVVVLISADSEWQAIKEMFIGHHYQPSPYGNWFVTVQAAYVTVIFFHGGWGKIAAAAYTQLAIDRWQPNLIINLGTCGGFEGFIERGKIVLVERTVVYDIFEQLVPYPYPARRTLIVSGDRDLLPNEITLLYERLGAVVGIGSLEP